MFSKDVIDSDRFLDMPPTAQNLYFHLGIQADDDGFVSSPKKIKRVCGAKDEDLKILEESNFIILFKSGVVVIADWKLNNYIQSDRYTPTIYVEEKNHLTINENKSYKYLENQCIQDVSSLDTQVSISNSKGSLDLEIVEDKLKQKSKEQSQFSLNDTENLSFADCLSFYENNFGDVGEIDIKSLERLSKKYGTEFLYESINKTSFRGDINSPLAYISKLLMSWKKKGFTTLEDIDEEQEAFNEQYD